MLPINSPLVDIGKTSDQKILLGFLSRVRSTFLLHGNYSAFGPRTLMKNTTTRFGENERPQSLLAYKIVNHYLIITSISLHLRFFEECFMNKPGTAQVGTIFKAQK